jgi:hypothetical protein
VSSATDPYLDAAVEQAWRLVALIDRNPHSPTRGSFSRTHWAWKFSDFPYPRFQEGVCALARFRDLPHPRNPLYQAPAIDDWISWGFEYWVSLQHGSGAYDEAYPNEQCLAATAFTCFYMGDAYARCRERLDPALRARVEATFWRAGQWLCENDETHGVLSNHLAVAAAALETVHGLLDVPAFSKRAGEFVDRILHHQSAEGWMREYDGADIGYGTHGFFYLAAYWRMTGSDRTRQSLDRFADFLRYFVHPDGTIGGEYASRNTEFYYPAGLEILAPVSAAAASIASGLRQSVQDRRVCGVWSMDDFNIMPMLNNLLFASEAISRATPGAPLPCDEAPFSRLFPESGLWVINRERFYAVVGLSKGGTVSVFDKTTRRLCARHAGLIATGGGKRFTSQDYSLSPALRPAPDGRSVDLEVPWKTLGTTVFGPTLFLLFRVFTLTLGRLPAVSRRVKELLVHTLIRRKTRPAVQHTRHLAIIEHGIEIRDVLQFPAGVAGFSAVEQFTAVHMGSALYADVRSRGTASGGHWPAGTGPVRLHGRLTTAGTTWEIEGA